MGGCLLRLQGDALNNIAGGALNDGAAAEDLREKVPQFGARHVLRHPASIALVSLESFAAAHLAAGDRCLSRNAGSSSPPVFRALWGSLPEPIRVNAPGLTLGIKKTAGRCNNYTLKSVEVVTVRGGGGMQEDNTKRELHVH